MHVCMYVYCVCVCMYVCRVYRKISLGHASHRDGGVDLFLLCDNPCTQTQLFIRTKIATITMSSSPGKFGESGFVVRINLCAYMYMYMYWSHMYTCMYMYVYMYMAHVLYVYVYGTCFVYSCMYARIYNRYYLRNR